MNDKIIKIHFFHNMKFDLKGQLRPFMSKIPFFIYIFD